MHLRDKNELTFLRFILFNFVCLSIVFDFENLNNAKEYNTLLRSWNNMTTEAGSSVAICKTYPLTKDSIVPIHLRVLTRSQKRLMSNSLYIQNELTINQITPPQIFVAPSLIGILFLLNQVYFGRLRS